jgi:hypothetical protein
MASRRYPGHQLTACRVHGAAWGRSTEATETDEPARGYGGALIPAMEPRRVGRGDILGG